jgi:hypothetical protein
LQVDYKKIYKPKVCQKSMGEETLSLGRTTSPSNSQWIPLYRIPEVIRASNFGEPTVCDDKHLIRFYGSAVYHTAFIVAPILFAISGLSKLLEKAF